MSEISIDRKLPVFRYSTFTFADGKNIDIAFDGWYNPEDRDLTPYFDKETLLSFIDYHNQWLYDENAHIDIPPKDYTTNSMWLVGDKLHRIAASYDEVYPPVYNIDCSFSFYIRTEDGVERETWKMDIPNVRWADVSETARLFNAPEEVGGIEFEEIE